MYLNFIFFLEMYVFFVGIKMIFLKKRVNKCNVDYGIYKFFFCVYFFFWFVKFVCDNLIIIVVIVEELEWKFWYIV